MLAEEDIAPSIIAMDGRRSRCTKSEHQLIGEGTGARQWKSHPVNIVENNFQDVSDAKLLRKLEAQGEFAFSKTVSSRCSIENQPFNTNNKWLYIVIVIFTYGSGLVHLSFL